MSYDYFDESSLILSSLEKREIRDSLSYRRSDLFAESIFNFIDFDPFHRPLPIKIGLRVKVIGTKIYSAKTVKGYYSQGIEESIKILSPVEDIEFFRRMKFNQPFFYQLAYVSSLEKYFGFEVSQKDTLHRKIALEIAKVFHNLTTIQRTLSFVPNDVQDLVEECLKVGQRVFSVFSQVETQAKNVKAISAKVAKNLFLVLKEYLAGIENEFQKGQWANKSLLGVGYISPKNILDFNLTGVFLRASGMRFHSEFNEPYGIMSPQGANYREGSDVLSRCLVRIEDVEQSLSWLLNEVDKFDTLDSIVFSKSKAFFDKTFLPTHSFFRLSVPEGIIRTNIFKHRDKEKFCFRMSLPAYEIFHALCEILSNDDISNLNLILGSLGINARELDK